MSTIRFQRLMREAHDALGLVEDEHRALGRLYAEAVAENKRLRFQIYGKHPMRFQNKLRHSTSQPLYRKFDTYFDVTKWRWTAEVVVPYSVSQ